MLLHMTAEIIQIRDVPADDVAALRTRAARHHMSLSAYLRALIHDDVARPTMEEVVTRISTRQRVEAEPDEIRAYIDADRR